MKQIVYFLVILSSGISPLTIFAMDEDDIKVFMGLVGSEKRKYEQLYRAHRTIAGKKIQEKILEEARYNKNNTFHHGELVVVQPYDTFGVVVYPDMTIPDTYSVLTGPNQLESIKSENIGQISEYNK